MNLAGGLVDDPQVKPVVGGIALTGSAIDAVNAFLPITVQGQLDTGGSVTLLNARNYGGHPPFGTPHYIAYNAVLGAHVTGVDQLYTAVRFRPDHPLWLRHLAEGESSVVEDDGSTLSVETSDDGNWLVYSSSTPITLRQLEVRVVSGCLVLLQLALHPDLITRETQVRVDRDGPWLSMHGPGFCATPPEFDPETLLPPDELMVERFAKWIALNDKLDGLAWAVARPNKGALQEQVLVTTSLVEGLHRRLPSYKQNKFPGAAKEARRRILDAARDAVGEQADAEGLDREAARPRGRERLDHIPHGRELSDPRNGCSGRGVRCGRWPICQGA